MARAGLIVISLFRAKFILIPYALMHLLRTIIVIIFAPFLPNVNDLSRPLISVVTGSLSGSVLGGTSAAGGGNVSDLSIKDFDLESMRGGVNELKSKVAQAERER